MTYAEEYVSFMNATFMGGRPGSVGVAVSGGGDSIALLRAACADAAERGYVVMACTVDHGLRDGSADEARWVGEVCLSLGVEHDVLRWEEGPSSGDNVQEAARSARISLIGSWARDSGCDCVMIGHNEDDVAENYLMRGVGIPPIRVRSGLPWVRPLLSCSRASIREALRSEGAAYVDDPSNENEKFRRVTVRRELSADPVMREAALAGAASATAARRRSAAEALSVLSERVEISPLGFVSVSLDGCSDDGLQEALRVIVRAISSEPPRIRPGRLESAAERCRGSGRFTFAGCVFSPADGSVMISPEPSRCRDVQVSRGDGGELLGPFLRFLPVPEGGTLSMESRPSGRSVPVLTLPCGSRVRPEFVPAISLDDLIGERFFGEPEAVRPRELSPGPDL